MKLIIIAAVIAVCSAGRLEHLERSYLPPDNTIGSGKHGSSSGRFGSSFEMGSSLGHQHGSGRNSFSSVSNRYLPPGKEAINDVNQITGKDFGGIRGGLSSSQQYSPPRTSYGASQRSGVFNGHERSQSQFSAPNRQYLAPDANSNQNGQFGSPSRQYLTPNAGSSQNGRQQYGSASGSQYQSRSQYRSQNQQFGSATSRQYLAPHAGVSQGIGPQQFGSSNSGQQQRLGATPSRQYLTPQANSFANNGQKQFGASNNFQQQQGGAPNRRYLAPQAADSLFSSQQSIGGSNFGQQQKFGAHSKHFTPDAEELVSSQGQNPQFNQQHSSGFNNMNRAFGNPSRQYLAPRINNPYKGIPQQQFNERTGYQY